MLGIAASILLFCLMTITFADVVARYLLNRPIRGAFELTELGLLVLMSFIAALRAQYVRHDPLLRGISFGSMMGIIALMIHSAVDFNLQIPANALAFMLVLAFGWLL